MSRTRREPHAEADLFNTQWPIGTRVRYQSIKGEGPSIEYKTRTAAEVLSGHTAVVWLEGKSGCVAISHCTPVDPYELQHLSSESVLTLLIEGHVDLTKAEEAARVEGQEGYEPFTHAWWRYTVVPEGEDDEGEPGWREPCNKHDPGAEPVTVAQKAW
jgi:hypothetical protein